MNTVKLKTLIGVLAIALMLFVSGCFRAGQPGVWTKSKLSKYSNPTAIVKSGYDSVLAGDRRAVYGQQQFKPARDITVGTDCDNSDDRAESSTGVLCKKDRTGDIDRAGRVYADNGYAGQDIDLKQIIGPLAATAIVALAIGYNIGRWLNDKAASDN